MKRFPLLYEANAAWLLARLSNKHGRRLTLGAVPAEEWQELARRGFELLWLMGVWERSPGARHAALTHSDLRRAYADTLQDWTDKDVSGSPYAVHDYRLDPSLGGEGELLALKEKLNAAGLGLMLDFVPNHLALDHAWTASAPGRFVQQSDGAMRLPPDGTFRTPAGVRLAHGRDPNFPPWGDTVQVNYFSTDARRAMLGELRHVASQCDGVRCDMAMLILNKVFERVWGPLVPGPRPPAEFWSEAFAAVRADRPSFVFLAEAYWGHEWELQELGFDYTYDKTLYDRLRHAGAGEVRAHLAPDGRFQERSAHFIENHDEPRAAAAFGRDKSLAAAAAAMLTPGLRFFHDGQLEGRRLKAPIQLVREPLEPVDEEARRFYDRLLEALADPILHDGEWRSLSAGPLRPGDAHENLLVWSWTLGGRRRLAAINYSPAPAAGAIDGAGPIELGPWGVRLYDAAQIR